MRTIKTGSNLNKENKFPVNQTRLLKMSRWWYLLKSFICSSPCCGFACGVISILMNLANIQPHNISPTMAAKYQMGSGDFSADVKR